MTLPKQASPRKGARRIADIPPGILSDLNRGVLESASLVEGLAVDFHALMTSACPKVTSAGLDRIRAVEKKGITRRMAAAGAILFETYGPQGVSLLSVHPSDTVRGWAAYLLAENRTLSLEEKLAAIRPLADDPHFGVREWAWLALRADIAEDIEKSIMLLTEWIDDTSENIRRFAVEATRPRGVWTPHVPKLKETPALGEPLLEPLLNDPSRYVQNSVANWLNDAAKTSPGWVTGFLRSRPMHRNDAFEYIRKRALRSMKPLSGKSDTRNAG